MSGIVRRIDELGRIVIPKEIRKVLNIKQGSAISIQTSDQSIILNKYCSIKNIADYVDIITTTLFECTGYSVVISDQEKVISCIGVSKSEFYNKPLSETFVEKSSIARCYYNKEVFNIVADQTSSIPAMCVVPIMVQGSLLGSIVLIEKTTNKQITTCAESVVKCMANYLANLLN